MNLSAHFTKEEFEASEVATRKGIDNRIPPPLIQAAALLCEHVLEPARAALGPIRVNSGYRCRALNVAIGGATRSQHTLGQAADIVALAAGVTNYDLFKWIIENAPYDQVIDEFNFSWVHVSYTNSPRRNILVASMVPGKKRAKYTEIGPEQLSTLV